MNCTEFLSKLTDYFDGQIDPELLAEVKEHLGSCHHCEIVVSTTQKTISIYKHQQPYEFPEELSTRLREAVMKRCAAAGRPEAKTAAATAPSSRT